MRNLKRFLAMTLTMLMVVGSFAMTGSVAAFDDVVDYQQQINLMSVLKIIEGYSEDEFGPENDVERWHMALWIAKIMTGKVDDAYVNWYSTQNNTAFEDLEVDNFYGSISYCNENGVVIGTSATTFEPTNGIMIQDVFTMVVRMLGYGSSSMDSNYPWSYVDKAIQLGLDKDLAADYNNEDVATREQAAVILYNALFAKKSDGKTYAEAKFNLTIDTVVLTGTSKANMFAAGDVEGKKLASENYVAFNQLNEDGTLGSETFYLLKSWFGFDEDYDENLYFGQSYKVISKDNFASLIYVEAVEGYALDQTDFDGVKDSGATIKIEGKDYKAVKEFTYLNRAQGSKTTDELEVIVYDVNNRTTVNLSTSYIMDANRNILNKDGSIYLYYNADHHQTGSSDWRAPYTLKIKIDGVEVYVKPSQADWDKAYTYATSTKTGAMRKVGEGFSSNDLFNVNAYSDTVLYDDNFDGIFDRAFYTYYKFGFISYNDDSFLTIDGAKIFGDVKYTDAAITYVTADGEKLDAADVVKALDTNLSKGNYVLYTYNASNKYVTIKEFFTPNKGLVTSIDKPNGTITFDQVYYNITAGNVAGSKFNVGNAKLPGATKNEVIANIPNGNLDYLQGRNVHYIEKDGNVLAIYEAYKNAGKYLVFDSVVGINSTGYVNALVYNNSNTRSVITIASVDGDWYGFDTVTRRYYTNVDYLYESYGELFTYTVDALGNYHVKWLNPDKDYTYYYQRAGLKNNKAFDKVSIEFINGIAVPVINNKNVDGIREYNFFENADGVAKAFKQFNTNADTVIVVMDRKEDLHAWKGIPNDGAILNIYSDVDWARTFKGNHKFRLDVDSARIFVDQTDDDKPSVAKFIYVYLGSFSKFTTRNAWDIYSNDTIIFIDDDTAATEIITNQVNTGYGVTQGATYSYNKAIDFVRGGVVNNILTYNNRLVAGNFYSVKDGYVDANVTNNKAYVDKGYLQYIDTYETVWTYANNDAKRTNYRTNYLYELKGTEITDVSADDNNPKNMVNSVKATINTDGAYAPVYYYAGNIDSTANVFIYSTITQGVSTSKAYLRQDWVSTELDIIDYIWNRGSIKADVKLEKYVSDINTGGYTAFNLFEISRADYDSISATGYRSNDAFNQVVDFVGTNIQLYKKTATGRTLVENFNDENVSIFTRVMYTNYDGYRYFIGFTTNPSFTSKRVGGGESATATGNEYILGWTENGKIAEKTMTLKGFGLEAARYAILSVNGPEVNGPPIMMKTRAQFPINENRVELFGNLNNVWHNETTFDWSDTFLQYSANKFKINKNSLPAHIIEDHLGNKRCPTQAIVTWANDLYLKVPIVDGYKATVGVYKAIWVTDGTNGTHHWKNVLDWHYDTTKVAFTEVDSLHPKAYEVYKISIPFESNVYIDVDYIKDEVVTPVYNELTIELLEGEGNRRISAPEGTIIITNGTYAVDPYDFSAVKYYYMEEELVGNTLTIDVRLNDAQYSLVSVNLILDGAISANIDPGTGATAVIGTKNYTEYTFDYTMTNANTIIQVVLEPLAEPQDIKVKGNAFVNSTTNNPYKGVFVEISPSGANKDQIASLTVELFNAAGELIGTNTLNNVTYAHGTGLTSPFVVSSAGGYTASAWTTSWVDGQPNVGNAPAKAVITAVDNNGVSYTADITYDETLNGDWASIWS